MSRSPTPVLRIGVAPFETGDNPYIDRMKEIIGRIGSVKPFPTPRQFFFHPIRFFKSRYDFAILNWIESQAIDKDGHFSWVRGSALLVYILAAKLVAREIIWIRHNNYPHDTAPASISRAKFLMHLIERLVNKTISHSGRDAVGQRSYVPHPLYKVVSGGGSIPDTEYYFVFGRILPYKKLHEAIQAVPDDIQLIIAGSAPDQDYLDWCKKLADGKENVRILPGYMEAATACDFAIHSNGVVVLNSDEDMVVSGNHLFAFSLGVPLFTVTTPFIDWLVNEKGMIGVYAYPSVRELLQSLPVSSKNVVHPDPGLIQAEFGDEAVERAVREILRVNHE